MGSEITEWGVNRYNGRRGAPTQTVVIRTEVICGYFVREVNSTPWDTIEKERSRVATNQLEEGIYHVSLRGVQSCAQLDFGILSEHSVK